MLRLLIRDITVEKLTDARQAVLHICWQGGGCTDTGVQLPSPITERPPYPPQLIDRVRELSSQISDPQIAKAVSEQGLRSSRGLPFTLPMIKAIRIRYDVPSVCLKLPGELTVRQLSDRLVVSVYVVHNWIKLGVVQARKLDGHGPWWITITEQQEQRLLARVRTSAQLTKPSSNAHM